MSVLALRNLHVGYGGIKAVKGIDVRHKNRGFERGIAAALARCNAVRTDKAPSASPAQRGCDRPSRRRMPEGKMR